MIFSLPDREFSVHQLTIIDSLVYDETDYCFFSKCTYFEENCIFDPFYIHVLNPQTMYEIEQQILEKYRIIRCKDVCNKYPMSNIYEENAIICISGIWENDTSYGIWGTQPPKSPPPPQGR